MIISLPNEVEYIIDTLESGGFEAYAVGGCVRDSLLGKTPQDWDVCTSALPEQTQKCFENHHVIETGLKHGTVTLMLNNKPFEITTYRVDGKYKDNRRPETVKFVNVLKRDLARRDFSINAMAYNPKTGIVDYYDGQQDLADGKIKTVGNPNKRFSEDALRIMRAVRFASQFGYEIEENTKIAMIENRKLLDNIASERIREELNKILLGDNVFGVLSSNMDILTQIIPELERCIGFEQNSPYHCYDVLEHALRSVDAAPKNLVIRLTMIFHDIAKPLRYSESDDGVGHFYGHAKESEAIARDVLNRLKYDNETTKAVTQLVLYHDADILPEQKYIKRWLNKIGEDRLRELLVAKRADTMAKTESCQQKEYDGLDKISQLIDEIIEQQQCFSLKDLAVNGRDLIDAGIAEGAQIGDILKKLVDMVIDEEVQNDKDILLSTAKTMI